MPLTTELKFAECLDIFVQMCITKLKYDNVKDMCICTECGNINCYFISKSDFSSLYFKLLFYRTRSKGILYT